MTENDYSPSLPMSGDQPILSANVSYRVQLARAFRNSRLALAEELYRAVRESYPTASERFVELDEWQQLHFLAAIDLTVKWLDKADQLHEDLLVGWFHSQLREPMARYSAEGGYDSSEVLSIACTRWLSLLRSQLSSGSIQLLKASVLRVTRILASSARKKLRVLFIGDCLMSEVITALTGPCVRSRLAIEPVQIHERVQPSLRNQIRGMNASEFDLVFFSPFTHRFMAEYSHLLDWQSALGSRADFFNSIDGLLNDVFLTVQTLSRQFQCPIYVHNTAGTVQTFGIAVGLAKSFVSYRNRRDLRSVIKKAISRRLSDPSFEGRVRLLDEAAMADKTSAWALGKVFLRGDLYHPTKLGLELGRGAYVDALLSVGLLATKKLVVCDLDNTIWDGVIGEGPVTHYLDRQQILKDLRFRGILLSINSKNDPEKVNFTGAILQPDDFVATRINWQPKVSNMFSIIEELNLKVKDFIFIDDRPDELERMQNSFPDILALDAKDPATWRRLLHWGSHLSVEGQEGDRTKLYHERAAREKFLSIGQDFQQTREDEQTALINLELSIQVEEVNRSNLKRVVELINRTNQFNLCGSRTTVRDLESGLGSQHWVLTATAKDKFGNMGIIGVMKADRKVEAIEIPIFVLSCRVFGFGIEYALLNSVRLLASPSDLLVGHYRETQHNEPGRQLYARSGLTWDGEKWVGKIANLPADPAWLRIEKRVSSRLPAEVNA